MDKIYSVGESLLLKFKDICLPSQIYMVIGLLGIAVNIMNPKSSIIAKILSILVVGLFSFVFDILCKAGYTFMAWILLLLPYCLALIFLITMVVTFNSKFKKLMNSGKYKKLMKN
jgi:hypothetical protein